VSGFEQLLAAARAVVAPRRLSETAVCGTVGAAIETANGDVFVGICVDTASSMGFCAEHSAAAAMLTAGQSQIVRMVAVDRNGAVLAPCGRCREFIIQLDPANADTVVMVDPDLSIALRELLPFR
jgi:cytidine deaminase